MRHRDGTFSAGEQPSLADASSALRVWTARASNLASRARDIAASDHLGLRLAAATLMVGGLACVVWVATASFATL
jgi:hypothetical protein